MEAIPAAREEQSRGPSSPERTSSLECKRRAPRREGRGARDSARNPSGVCLYHYASPVAWRRSTAPGHVSPGKAVREGSGRGRSGPWRWGWGRPAPARDSWRNGARARTRGLAGLQRLCFCTPSPIASLDRSGGGGAEPGTGRGGAGSSRGAALAPAERSPPGGPWMQPPRLPRVCEPGTPPGPRPSETREIEAEAAGGSIFTGREVVPCP